MHEDENEDFGVINFHGKVIDLNYLARKGDGLFEKKLNELSEGLVTQNELLGFVSDLKGRSWSKTDSGMYVDASKFGDLLPDKWKILLSLRPGVIPPSLYCKKFVR
ncbi:zinc finger, C2H2-like, DNA-binding domain protein [Tanacetum coccineum]